MNDYLDISIADYTYKLPDERIAKYPLARRDASKLLYFAADGTIHGHRFNDLPELLPKHSLMVYNDTKVIRARLEFFKATGGRIEIFLLDPLPPHSYETVFNATRECTWHCLIGNAKKWRGTEPLSSTISLPTNGVQVTLTATRCEGDEPAVTLSWSTSEDGDPIPFATLLESFGELPIPPYLNRATEESDLTTYQTLFAAVQGSVAAPTAALHFTPEVMRSLHQERSIISVEVTLHVGAGTFKPVKSETMAGHDMHTEAISLSLAALRSIRAYALEGVTAVGTTSTRTLESLYYIGVHLLEGTSNPFEVEQWEPYQRSFHYTTTEAIDAIICHLEQSASEMLLGATRIIIVPGFQFRLVRRLVTNFHQPHSTLLLLIAAFVGDDWRRIYEYALEHDYRFLSYGDSSLLTGRK